MISDFRIIVLLFSKILVFGATSDISNRADMTSGSLSGIKDRLLEPEIRYLSEVSVEESTLKWTGGRMKRQATVSSILTDQQKQEVIQTHNSLRRLEQASDMQYMVWNDYLASMAQEWSASCVWWHGQPYRDPSTMPYNPVGQNLYMALGKVINITSLIGKWYSEKPYYNYTTTTCLAGQMCGHYTQVVWSQSRKVGCGRSFCGTVLLDPKTNATYSNATIFACNYGPAGNYVGAKPYQLGDACTACSSGQFWCDRSTPSGLCRTGNCSSDSIEGNCECQASCQNGGVADCQTCQCQCSIGWGDVNCAKICMDYDSRCGKTWPKSYCNDTNYGELIRSNCFLTCELCQLSNNVSKSSSMMTTCPSTESQLTLTNSPTTKLLITNSQTTEQHLTNRATNTIPRTAPMFVNTVQSIDSTTVANTTPRTPTMVSNTTLMTTHTDSRTSILVANTTPSTPTMVFNTTLMTTNTNSRTSILAANTPPSTPTMVSNTTLMTTNTDSRISILDANTTLNISTKVVNIISGTIAMVSNTSSILSTMPTNTNPRIFTLLATTTTPSASTMVANKSSSTPTMTFTTTLNTTTLAPNTNSRISSRAPNSTSSTSTIVTKTTSSTATMVSNTTLGTSTMYTTSSTPMMVTNTTSSTPMMVINKTSSTPMMVTNTTSSTPMMVTNKTSSTPVMVTNTISSTPMMVINKTSSTSTIVTNTTLNTSTKSTDTTFSTPMMDASETTSTPTIASRTISSVSTQVFNTTPSISLMAPNETLSISTMTETIVDVRITTVADLQSVNHSTTAIAENQISALVTGIIIGLSCAAFLIILVGSITLAVVVCRRLSMVRIN